MTEIIEATQFYPAENYHENYYNRNRSQPYCQMVIEPKVQKLLKEYGEYVK